MTGLRGIAGCAGRGDRGVARSGKWKTGFQIAAITALLIHWPFLGLPAHEIGLALLAIATALTVLSGYAYLRGYFRAAASAPLDGPDRGPDKLAGPSTSSSVGRAPRCQRGSRRFESGLVLQFGRV